MRSTIGANIRRYRRARDLTVAELAQLIGSKREYVSKLENKTPKNPSIEKLQAIADVFGVSVSELCEPYTDQEDSIVTSDSDKKFIQKYLMLSSTSKKHIQKIIDTY